MRKLQHNVVDIKLNQAGFEHRICIQRNRADALPIVNWAIASQLERTVEHKCVTVSTLFQSQGNIIQYIFMRKTQHDVVNMKLTQLAKACTHSSKTIENFNVHIQFHTRKLRRAGNCNNTRVALHFILPQWANYINWLPCPVISVDISWQL